MANLRSTGIRYRDELSRTYYGDRDRRRKLATVKVIKYSDGRQYRSVKLHRGATKDEFRSLLLRHASYATKLLK